MDEIYDQLVKNRDEQARKLGYANYVQLGYDRLGQKLLQSFRRQSVPENRLYEIWFP